MSVNLLAELQTLALSTNGSAVRRLVALGVNRVTIANMGLDHYSFGVGGAAAVEGGLYEPDPNGAPHLVLPVYEDGELLDLVAFQTSQPYDWRLRVGAAWALGVERGLADHYWADQVNLWSSPLEWLRRDCDGLCVVDWTAPEVHKLRDIANIKCSDALLADTLGNALNRPFRAPNITIQSGDIDYAAAA